MKELIEQIGRERLENIAQFHRSMSLPPSHDEIESMARALLAVLDAKPVGTVSIAMDWSTHRNIATVNMRPDLVLSEMRDGDNLYATPPAASEPVSKGYTLPDGLVVAVNSLLDSDGSRGTFSAIRRGDALAEVERFLAAAPSPGGDTE